jgi:hypothetical protein
MEMISPKYRMKLNKQVADAIWAEYGTFKRAIFYFEQWRIKTPFIHVKQVFFMHKQGSKNKIKPLVFSSFSQISKIYPQLSKVHE